MNDLNALIRVIWKVEKKNCLLKNVNRKWCNRNEHLGQFNVKKNNFQYLTLMEMYTSLVSKYKYSLETPQENTNIDYLKTTFELYFQ